MMKRILLTLATLLFGFGTPVALTVAASAAVGPFDAVCQTADPGNLPEACKDNAADSGKTWQELNPFSGEGGILLRVARLLAFVTGVASVIIIIISGLRYVTANGDSNSINGAKNGIVYAVVGIVVSLLAQGIIIFVVNRLD